MATFEDYAAAYAPKPRRKRRVNARTGVFIAARKRGWSLDEIAFAAGISRERVRQILAKADVVGTIRLKHRNSHQMKRWRTCVRCGKTELVDVTQAKLKFCGKKCYSLSVRKGGGRMGTLAAIEQRLTGAQWTEIQRTAGVSYQTLSLCTWWLLVEYGMLTYEIVEQIFSPRMAEYLFRSTGENPTHAGAPKNWLELLRKRIEEDGDDRPMIRKHTLYLHKQWAAKTESTTAKQMMWSAPPAPAAQMVQSTRAWIGKPWTQEDYQFLIDNRAHMTGRELAQQLNRRIETVYKKCTALGLKGRGPGSSARCGWRQGPPGPYSLRFSDNEIAYMKAHLSEGNALIARALRRQTRAVRLKIKQLGLSAQVPKYKYTKRPWSEERRENYRASIGLRPRNARGAFMRGPTTGGDDVGSGGGDQQ